jgi:hypothetical protein
MHLRSVHSELSFSALWHTVVKALPAVRSQERPAGGLVVPWLIGRAGFHRRENGKEPGMRASLLDQRGDLIGFAQAAGADKFDVDAIWKRPAQIEP